MTEKEMQAEMARLTAENEALKAKQASGRRLYFKVSDKGAVSAYGMGRFPVTLYQEQWLALMDKSAELQEFIKANTAKLKVKGQEVVAA